MLDNEGNKMSERTNIGTRRYGYDEIYQLTSAVYERNQQFTWQYDAAGNRTYSSMLNAQGSMSRTYAPNNLNQYVSTLNIEHGTLNNYLYDSDGNLLSDGTRTMAWDIRNRLTQVINGSKTINYKYDHNDLRMEKDVVVGTIHELSRYYYDGSLLLAEKDIDGKLQKTYINDGEGIVGFIRYIYDDSGTFSHYQRLYYLYDSLGSVSYITGENGLPLQNYTYSPYGSTLNVERDPLNGLRFVGRYGGYADDDSGLVYFWHRWYDERDGRWVSRDPVGLDAGINVYQYVFNIPNYFIDWYGLCPDGEPKPVPLPRPNQPYVDPGWYNWNKLPWDARIPPRQGNYCGKNWSEGRFKLEGEENTFTVPALDDIDECCRKHDECSYKVRSGREKCKTIPNCNKDLILNMFSPNLIIRNICGYIIYLILPLLWLGIIIYFL